MSAKQIPNQIDDPNILMFWSMDEFLPFTVVLAMGFLAGSVITAAAIACVAVWKYKRIRDGNPRGYFLHLLYWAGLVSRKNSKTIHNPFIREFRQ